MKSTSGYMRKYGLPTSFYVDYGSVFSVNTNNPEREKKSQFERACNELGVRVIHASSPQAKGRVERANKTLQDRLVKEMRLRGISTIAEANQFVQAEFIEMHNAHYAVLPEVPQDAHRPVDRSKLANVFCIKERRTVRNDHTIAYKNRIFQLGSQQRTIVQPKNFVQIYEHLDGNVAIWIRKTRLNFVELAARPKKVIGSTVRSNKVYKPAANHPWRTYNTRSTAITPYSPA